MPSEIHILAIILLESLECSGLLKPKIRLQWPEPVARRLWLNRHDDVKNLHDPIEPDGPRWSAALRLSELERYSVCKDELLEACKFLAKRWGVWDSEGREFASQAYRRYLAAAVRMLQTSRKMDLNDIATAVGYQSNHTTSTLRVIWPDWAEEQKERLIRTLRPTADSKDARTLSLDEIRAFADFVEKEYQDAIFLRLESFEAYAFERS